MSTIRVSVGAGCFRLSFNGLMTTHELNLTPNVFVTWLYCELRPRYGNKARQL